MLLHVMFLAAAVLHGAERVAGSANPSRPSPTGCTLVAKTNVWLNVYQQDKQGGKGVTIFADLSLKQNETQRIDQVPNNAIVYTYRIDTSQPYQRETHASCSDGVRVFVP
jgi:hypothetical protein